MIKVFLFIQILLLFISNVSAEQLCLPVQFNEQVLTCLSKGVGSISLEQRIENIEAKIESLAKDYSADAAALQVINEDEKTYSVVYKDISLITLSEKDRLDSYSDVQGMAYDIKDRMSKSVLDYRVSRSSEKIGFGVLWTVIASIVLYALISLISRGHRFLDSHVVQFSEKLGQTKGSRLFQVIPVFRFRQLATGVLQGAKVVLMLALFYFYIPLVLSFFPWTAKFAPQIIHFIVEPFKKIFSVVIGYAPNVFYIVAILIFTRFLVKLVKVFFDEIEYGTITFENFHKDWAKPTFSLVRGLMYAISLVMIFPYLPGSSSPAFQGLSVFLGVLVSFGSGSSIANIISGIVITYMRPFKLGDRVRIADTQGDVIEKNFLVTRIRTIKNVDITIPNSMVLGSHIINFSSTAEQQGLILNTTITIGYDVPWKLVHELLLKAAANTEDIDQSQKSFILQTALNDFNVAYELNAYTRHSHRMAKVYSDLHKNIQDSFNEAGVEIMSPNYLALRDGNEVTIPEKQRPTGYTKPAFNFKNQP